MLDLPSALAAAPFPLAGELSSALSALLWGSAGIVIARISPALTAGALNYGKNLFATICFVALLWIVSGSPLPSTLSSSAFWIFAASGFLGLALCDTFLLRSLLDIGPQRMSTVFLCVPALAALIAVLPPFSERTHITVWLGIAVCLGGILLAIRRHPVHDVDPERFRRGVRNAFLAALLQTGAVLLARYGLYENQAPLLESAVVRMTAGTLGLVAMGAVRGRLGSWHRQLSVPKSAFMLAGASFFGTFLGILTNQAGLQWAVHAGVATTLNSLMPIYLLPLSVIFLKERFGKRAILATLIAVAGVALMMSAP
jgi:drug/metabolite transporter (DMT)-like permease